MPDPLEVAAPVARRFLVLRHVPGPPRALPPEPQRVLAVVDRLGSLQFDPLEEPGFVPALAAALRACAAFGNPTAVTRPRTKTPRELGRAVTRANAAALERDRERAAAGHEDET